MRQRIALSGLLAALGLGAAVLSTPAVQSTPVAVEQASTVTTFVAVGSGIPLAEGADTKGGFDVSPSSAPVTAGPTATSTAPAGVYYRNCDEARAAGAAPIGRGEPGYRAGLDRDGDGWACDQDVAESAPAPSTSAPAPSPTTTVVRTTTTVASAPTTTMVRTTTTRPPDTTIAPTSTDAPTTSSVPEEEPSTSVVG